jgi:hypothetical protein
MLPPLPRATPEQGQYYCDGQYTPSSLLPPRYPPVRPSPDVVGEKAAWIGMCSQVGFFGCVYLRE